MRILIACEESQAVCKEFRLLGHEAYSCDIIDCSGGNPEWHIKDDVLNVINQGWDMMIGFPPCTHLAVSGSRHFEQKRKDGRQQQGIDFFMSMINAPIPKIAVENPIGIMSRIYRKPNQIIQPYHHCHEASKSTCLWLKELPLLKPTNIVGKGEVFISSTGKKYPAWSHDAVGKNGKKKDAACLLIGLHVRLSV
jgi:hypothetical protein